MEIVQAHHDAQQGPSLRLLFIAFLRMGITAFGGPAMIAYIRKMAVGQKKWLDQESFQDGVALCQTIPGATAMQMAAYVGLKARGVPGADPVTSALVFRRSFSCWHFPLPTRGRTSYRLSFPSLAGFRQ